VDAVRAAIQALFDADGEGWQVGQWVAVVGIERMRDDGGVEATSWYFTEPGQAEWMTAGLLESAKELRETAEFE
jgi:hypothetical protein